MNFPALSNNSVNFVVLSSDYVTYIAPTTIGTGNFVNHVRLIFNRSIDGLNLGEGNSCCKVLKGL